LVKEGPATDDQLPALSGILKKMSVSEVLHELPSWKPQDRQALVRRVMELDDQGLTTEELKLAETRLEAHRKDPSSALSPNEVLGRLKKLITR
jgi:hypothetical protein